MFVWVDECDCNLTISVHFGNELVTQRMPPSFDFISNLTNYSFFVVRSLVDGSEEAESNTVNPAVAQASAAILFDHVNIHLSTVIYLNLK